MQRTCEGWEIKKPTEKQLRFIKAICEELCLEDPKPKTMEEARKFISEHADKFYEEVQWVYQSTWAIENGYY